MLVTNSNIGEPKGYFENRCCLSMLLLLVRGQDFTYSMETISKQPFSAVFQHGSHWWSLQWCAYKQPRKLQALGTLHYSQTSEQQVALQKLWVASGGKCAAESALTTKSGTWESSWILLCRWICHAGPLQPQSFDIAKSVGPAILDRNIRGLCQLNLKNLKRSRQSLAKP